MNEPTANAPHCCPATRWDTEEAGCVFICDGRRRIIKTNPPPKRKPNRNEEEEGGGSRWEGLLWEHAAPACPSQGEGGVGGGDVSPPAMRMQPPPHCPPCIQWGRSHRGSAGGVCGSAGGVYVQVLCRGDERGRGGEIKTKRRRRKKYNPSPPPKKKNISQPKPKPVKLCWVGLRGCQTVQPVLLSHRRGSVRER